LTENFVVEHLLSHFGLVKAVCVGVFLIVYSNILDGGYEKLEKKVYQKSVGKKSWLEVYIR